MKRVVLITRKKSSIHQVSTLLSSSLPSTQNIRSNVLIATFFLPTICRNALKIYLHVSIPGRLSLLCFLFPLSYQYGTREYYKPWLDGRGETTRWVRVPPENPYRRYYRSSVEEEETGRHFRPETIHKITETLGALNTVGRYLVNMTRNGETPNNLSAEVPSALYTISKNFLGRNVTDTIAPLVREALPVVIDNHPAASHNNNNFGSNNVHTDKVDKNDEDDEDNSKSCSTPEGVEG